MQISMDKKYKTTDGLDVRLLRVDRKLGEFCGPTIVGLISRNGGYEELGLWRGDGASVNARSSLVEVSPYDDFKKDEPVMVLKQEGCWIRRYFSHVKDGIPHCFVDGGTSWSSNNTVVSWSDCRRPTPEELVG